MNFHERAFKEVKEKEFAPDDPLGIRWRTRFAIDRGIDRIEAYATALELAGLLNAATLVREGKGARS